MKAHSMTVTITLLECHPRHYQIRGCKNLTPENIHNVDEHKGDLFYEAVATRYPDLEFLDLTKMTRVTNKGFVTLIKGCPKLLPGNIRCKGDLFHEAMLKHCPDRKWDEYSNYHHDLTFEEFLRHLRDVCNPYHRLHGRVYNIIKHCKITMKPYSSAVNRDRFYFATGNHVFEACKGKLLLEALTTYRPNLTELDLRAWIGVADKELAMLVEKCLKLQPDNIKSNKKGDAFVAAVAKHRPDLENIDLRSCPVSERSLVSLMERCKTM